ncbi:hypothetical protein SAMN05660242_1244 [Thermoanaerobacterium sp. RBIITD]|nr:DUF6557 family protein [Thermoanaerobacterium sp. RBIITD]SNX53677.1 hypothetical protein SAMN05660242_1244 [Thermoanaerobacterium sp. RBIITD]
MELSLFEEWAGYEISDIVTMKDSDITAHILWVMRFFGYSNKEINKARKMLNKRINNIEKHPERFIKGL